MGLAKNSMAKHSLGLRLPDKWKRFLVVIDAHSKWIKMEIVNSTTAQDTIEHLRMIFAFWKRWLLIMEHVSPVVSSKSLHKVTILDMCERPRIIHSQIVWQKKQCRLLS